MESTDGAHRYKMLPDSFLVRNNTRYVARQYGERTWRTQWPGYGKYTAVTGLVGGAVPFNGSHKVLKDQRLRALT